MTPRWQTTSAGSSRALGDVDERGDDALLLLGSDSPPGKRKSSPPAPERRPRLGLLALDVGLEPRPAQSPTSTSLRRSSRRGSRPSASPTISAVSLARTSGLEYSAASPSPRGRLGQRARLLAAGVVERHVDLALEAALLVLGRLPVAREEDHRRGLHRVAAQAEAHRLQRQHLVRRDVAEVDVGPEALDEHDLLVLLRRLEDDLRRVDRVGDLVDEALAQLAVGARDAGGAVLAALADDLPRAGRELGLDLLDPAVRGHDLRRVLRADLAEDGEPLAGQAR